MPTRRHAILSIVRGFGRRSRGDPEKRPVFAVGTAQNDKVPAFSILERTRWWQDRILRKSHNYIALDGILKVISPKSTALTPSPAHGFARIRPSKAARGGKNGGFFPAHTGAAALSFAGPAVDCGFRLQNPPSLWNVNASVAVVRPRPIRHVSSPGRAACDRARAGER